MTKGVADLMVEVERVVDAFHTAVHVDADLEAALALVADGCALRNTPAGTGAEGDLRRYLAEGVLPHRPADLTFRRVSRTGNRWSVADETVVGFTFDRPLPWLLPGAAPTHRYAEVLAMSVVSVRRSLVTAHRTLWDHTGLVAQLGLEPAHLPRA